MHDFVAHWGNVHVMGEKSGNRRFSSLVKWDGEATEVEGAFRVNLVETVGGEERAADVNRHTEIPNDDRFEEESNRNILELEAERLFGFAH